MSFWGDDMARLYWMKLKRDFFKRHDIQIIESMPNGKDYVLFYLKLLCESIDHEGKLRFSDTIPYNEDMLATITNTNIDMVRSAMKVLVSLGLIEIFDDQTIYMSEVEKMIGSETESAERMRRQREITSKATATLPSPPLSTAQRQRRFRAKTACKSVQHVPFIEDYMNMKRYGGNYYIVMKRDKFKCCLCGGIEKLCVHHIDGYSEDKPENNAENKMLVLCRACHSQVHAGRAIPADVLESIDYFLDSNESNVTCGVTSDTEKEIDKDTEINREKEIESRSRAQRAPRFSPPTLEEVKAYCAERGNKVNAERFIDYYTANGWRVGRNPMKDWKAAVRTWEKGEDRTPQKGKSMIGEMEELYHQYDGEGDDDGDGTFE